MNDSLIKDIGRSYLVSSLVPAAFFTMLAVLLFQEFLPLVDNQTEGNSFLAFSSLGAVLVALTVWLGFTLYSAQSLIVRFYEGYLLPEGYLKGFLTSRQRSRYGRHEKYFELVRLLKQPLTTERIQEIPQLQPSALAQSQQLELRFPFESEDLLPTALGNVLRASENYSREKYRIDGITLWPRLASVLSDELTAALEERNNQLLFMLNSSLLSCILALAALFVVLARLSINSAIRLCASIPTLPSCQSISAQEMFDANSILYFLMLSMVFLTVSYILYYGGVVVAETYGLLVRTGFDLHRFELLTRLKFSLPKNLRDERRFWQKLNEFFVAGDRLGKFPVKLEYRVEETAQVEKTRAPQRSKSTIKQTSSPLDIWQ